MLVLTAIEQDIERVNKMTKLWHLPRPRILRTEDIQQCLRKSCWCFIEHLEVNVNTYRQLQFIHSTENDDTMSQHTRIISQRMFSLVVLQLQWPEEMCGTILTNKISAGRFSFNVIDIFLKKIQKINIMWPLPSSIILSFHLLSWANHRRWLQQELYRLIHFTITECQTLKVTFHMTITLKLLNY